MSLAEKVRAEREKKGWSQSDLARVTSIPQPTIWRLEKGNIEHPKADTLIALANTFKVPIDYLVQDEYELHPADLLRTDNDLRAMAETYLKLPEQDRQAIKQFADYLKPRAAPEEKRRHVDVAVKVRRVRKE